MLRFLYTYMAKLLLSCNRLQRYPREGVALSLATARTAAAQEIEGLSLCILDKGTGSWSFQFQFDDDSTCDAIASTEISSKDIFDVHFTDFLITNTAQAGVTGPKFLYGWRG